MDIKLKSLNGRIITINVNQTDTIGQIKSRVQEMEGISPDQQRILLHGYLLADDSVISTTAIKPESLLHLVLALRGGSGRTNFVNTNTKDLVSFPVIMEEEKSSLLANTDEEDRLYEISFSHSTVSTNTPRYRFDKKPDNKLCCAIL